MMFAVRLACGVAVGLVALSAALSIAEQPELGVKLTEKMKQRYRVLQELGRGAFGTVYLVRRSNGDMFALKTIANSVDGTTKREAQVMRSLHHRNVTRLFDLDFDTQNVNMVMQFMQGGSLQDRLNKVQEFSQQAVRLYFLQLCKAIDYLHDMGITHRDLKPDNILLASHDEITLLKVSDFGVSKNHAQYDLTSMCGTKLFMPPEYWKNVNYHFSPKVDIWSLGITIYFCISRQYPFANETQICEKNCSFYHPVWQKYPKKSKRLLRKMLNKNYIARPNASDILENDWISSQCVTDLYAKVCEKFE